MTKVSPMGIPCGYVGLPKGHPDYGKHYDDIDDSIEVHGGLTFSGYWEELQDQLWYLGFDCGHAQDLEIHPLASLSNRYIPRYISNKPAEYVEEQTKRLAEQLQRRAKR